MKGRKHKPGTILKLIGEVSVRDWQAGRTFIWVIPKKVATQLGLHGGEKADVWLSARGKRPRLIYELKETELEE